MKIIFTICSNNYLAQAKALGDSVITTNPDYHFFIGLVDNLSSEIDYAKEIVHPIVLCNEIGIPDFDSLWKKYDIIELNTCVKPFYLEYFTQKYSNLTHLMYFDPDTFVFGNIQDIEDELQNDKEIILTPHILTPIPLDGKPPTENTFLNYGIYNLGFIGIKNPSNNILFFNWWAERTYKVGFSNVAEGFFVDQLWMNLTPLFFENTIISRNRGLNMAPWNLHERFLSFANKNWLVNDSQKLVFFHFSSYDYKKTNQMSKHYDRYNFDNRQDLKQLYSIYSKEILDNNIEKLSKIPCSYIDMRQKYLDALIASRVIERHGLKDKIKMKLKRILKK